MGFWNKLIGKKDLADVKDMVVATLNPVQKSIQDLTNQVAESTKRQDHLLGHIETQNKSISDLQDKVYNLMDENSTLKKNNINSDISKNKHEQPSNKTELVQTDLKGISRIEKEIITLLMKNKLSYDDLTKKLTDKLSVSRVRGYTSELRKRGFPIISERYKKNKVVLFIKEKINLENA